MLPRIYHLYRLKYVALLGVVIFSLEYFGVFTHFFEEDFKKSFDYPLIDSNVLRYAKQMRNGQPIEVEPINVYNFTFLSNCRQKCRQADDDDTLVVPRIVFIIKSAMGHSDRRDAIRKSWGFEKRFSDVLIRTIFTLGIADRNMKTQNDLQASIDKESQQYNDIVQSDFIDSYYNNTIKTMMGMRWAIEYCPRSRFFMFVDDDYYVSTKNVLRFLRNPVHYPEYIDEADETLRKLARHLSQSDLLSENKSIAAEAAQIRKTIDDNFIHSVDSKKHMNQLKEFLTKLETKQAIAPERMIADVVKTSEELNTDLHGVRQLLDIELPYNVRLFAGFVFATKPHRHRSSKWFVTLDEYKWNMWPTYVTAGSFVLSREAIIEMYYMSMYTKHFR